MPKKKTETEDSSVNGFSVSYRNPGHWDITQRDFGRVFRIRGGPGQYMVIDERDKDKHREPITLNSVAACMAYICDELMFELIVADGQEPTVIESWNITTPATDFGYRRPQ